MKGDNLCSIGMIAMYIVLGGLLGFFLREIFSFKSACIRIKKNTEEGMKYFKICGGFKKEITETEYYHPKN